MDKAVENKHAKRKVVWNFLSREAPVDFLDCAAVGSSFVAEPSVHCISGRVARFQSSATKFSMNC